MPNLIQTVMNALPTDTLPKVAGLMGGSPSMAMSGMTAAVPALFAGALRESSTSAGATDLLSQVKQAMAGGNPLDRIGPILSDDRARSAYLTQGHDLADSLLGGQTSAVARLITTATNASTSAVSTLLAFLAPLVLGALGRAAGPTPTAAGLQLGLANERTGILKALPAGLDTLLGLGSAGAAAATAGVAAARDTMEPYMRWILGAIAVALLVFLGTRFFSTVRDTAGLVTLSLPGGASINVLPGSIGFGVNRFLASSDPAPKTFVFDNLNFDTASNRLTPESRPTVNTLAAILKAYPNASSRIIGYTDNQGDPTSNVRLSEARAMTVKQELVAGGVAPTRIETMGMGEANPIADNTTGEGRARNRRTELEIVSK